MRLASLSNIWNTGASTALWSGASFALIDCDTLTGACWILANTLVGTACVEGMGVRALLTWEAHRL